MYTIQTKRSHHEGLVPCCWARVAGTTDYVKAFQAVIGLRPGLDGTGVHHRIVTRERGRLVVLWTSEA